MSIELIQSELSALQNAVKGKMQSPPNCFTFMETEFVEYVSRTSLTVRIPVRSEYLNPIQKMQGGLISAAVDNAIGPLSYLAARAACTTLDLHTQYIRPIESGDVLTVTARITSRSQRTLTAEAEAFNTKGKLIARTTATMLVLS